MNYTAYSIKGNIPLTIVVPDSAKKICIERLTQGDEKIDFCYLQVDSAPIVAYYKIPDSSPNLFPSAVAGCRVEKLVSKQVTINLSFDPISNYSKETIHQLFVGFEDGLVVDL